MGKNLSIAQKNRLENAELWERMFVQGEYIKLMTCILINMGARIPLDLIHGTDTENYYMTKLQGFAHSFPTHIHDYFFREKEDLSGILQNLSYQITKECHF